MAPAPPTLREVAPAVAAKGADAPSLSPIFEFGPAEDLVLPSPAADAAAAAAAAAAADAAATTPPAPQRIATTCFDIFDAAVAARPSEPVWWSRPAPGAPFQPTTHAEAADQASDLAAALASLGAKRGGRVGVLGSNAPEWMLAMQACNRRAFVVVPVYDTLGDEAVRYTLTHGELTAVVAAADKLPALAKAASALKKGDAPLANVIVWGDITEPKAAAAVETLKKSPLAVNAIEWGEALALGRAAPEALRKSDPPLATDPCTLMYTSGTTGQPKGVLFTHSAIVAAVAALDATVKSPVRGFQLGDRFLSYLTLAHVFGRLSEELCFVKGLQIYYVKDMRSFNKELADAKPTMLCGVPRILERVSAGIDDGVARASPAQRLAFKAAVAVKRALQAAGVPLARSGGAASVPVVDTAILASARKALGGSVRAIVSGAAPLPRHVHEQLQAVFGCPVVEAYGLTETAAASFCMSPWARDQVGWVGLPCAGVQVRLESVPEMGYEAAPGLVVAGTAGGESAASPASASASSSALPRGEVLIKSPALFSRYYKNDEATAAALTPDGFFRTGDIGELCPRRGLRIIDRKKNIFKLSQGEYVAAEKIEMALERSPLVEQIFVYGNSLESVLVAAVVPKKRALLEWAKANGVGISGEGGAEPSFEAVCADAKTKAHVLAELNATARAAGLLGFEIPKSVVLESGGFWSPEQDLVTPTLKKKRPALQKKYQADIDAMYAELRAAENVKRQQAAAPTPAAAAPKPAAA